MQPAINRSFSWCSLGGLDPTRAGRGAAPPLRAPPQRTTQEERTLGGPGGRAGGRLRTETERSVDVQAYTTAFSGTRQILLSRVPKLSSSNIRNKLHSLWVHQPAELSKPAPRIMK
ncbi:uncharacterized protein [Dermacentor albipictus]|uniref:uncharacterized protein n=1 Tax=Dermacentor albipictus TaxID=60249 RepID=UPI0038FC4BF4